MKVLLFDIDGTLCLSGGAGLRAMTTAFEKIYGVKDALAGINLAGRTDTSIIMDALETFNLQFEEKTFFEYKDLYFDLIKDEIKSPGNGKKLAMPGVDKLLPELAKRDDIYMGLLTGNWEKSGRTKINEFGFDGYFSFGAFSDDSHLRNELLPFAVERFTKQYTIQPKADEVYVIGDTPADIHCAKPHGAVAVAVAASSHSMEDLAEHNPDYLLQDLSDTNKVLEILG